jgi:predicted nucleotidyltransferase component of viral defense system
MILLDQILQFYPDKLQHFRSFILREYLQYKILEIIFSSPFSHKLSFLGGTCLRIIHNNNRFSEDIDFDNFDLTEDNFSEISRVIKTELERQGFQIEIRNVFRGAFHCYIRFPELLHNLKLTGHSEQKILIQLDTEPHYFAYKPDSFILNKFDVFMPVNVTPPSILLSQKFYALLNRKRNKGRDFYDIVFLLKTTLPDYDYLTQKLNITKPEVLRKRVLDLCESINLNEMAKDVEPFLFDPVDVKVIRLFPDYIQQKI